MNYSTKPFTVIKKGATVVGSLSYEKKHEGHVYISGLVIAPQFQGQGIAKKALTQILKKLKSVKRMELVIDRENRRALLLYRSLGFAVESRKENYFGDGEPRLILALEN